MTPSQVILAAGGVVVIALLLALCFLPTIIALNRGKRNWVAIMALNILCGWTGIGWIGALVWALTYEENPLPNHRMKVPTLKKMMLDVDGK